MRGEQPLTLLPHNFFWFTLCCCSGSTALLCHVDPRSITTAWVGDSRAVLGRRRRLLQTRIHHQQQQQQNSAPQQQPQSSWEAIPLSMDHKPERRDESVSHLCSQASYLSSQHSSDHQTKPVLPAQILWVFSREMVWRSSRQCAVVWEPC